MLWKSALCALVLLAGCRAGDSAGPTVVTVPQALPLVALGDTGRIAYSVPQRSGQMTADEMRALLPRVERLRAEPDTIAVGIGDSVFIPRLVRILALDASGRVVGELRSYDFSMMGGLGPLRSGAIRAHVRGTARLTASWPRRLLDDGESAPPSAELTVLVGATRGVTVPPVARSGTASIAGVVRDPAGTPMSGVHVRVAKRGVLLQQTTTDEEGRFRVDELPAGLVHVATLHLGYVRSNTELELPGASAKELSFVLQPIGPLETILPSRRGPP